MIIWTLMSGLKIRIEIMILILTLPVMRMSFWITDKKYTQMHVYLNSLGGKYEEMVC